MAWEVFVKAAHRRLTLARELFGYDDDVEDSLCSYLNAHEPVL